MKTRTGALCKLVGFPGTDLVKDNHADEKPTKRTYAKDIPPRVIVELLTTGETGEIGRRFWEEQLRQSDKKHK